MNPHTLTVTHNCQFHNWQLSAENIATVHQIQGSTVSRYDDWITAAMLWMSGARRKVLNCSFHSKWSFSRPTSNYNFSNLEVWKWTRQYQCVSDEGLTYFLHFQAACTTITVPCPWAPRSLHEASSPEPEEGGRQNQKYRIIHIVGNVTVSWDIHYTLNCTIFKHVCTCVYILCAT